MPVGRIFSTVHSGNNPEGPFLGAFTLGVDGQQVPVTLPIPSVEFAGIWSPDGSRLLVNSFDGSSGSVGTLDVATGAWTELHPKGMAGEVGCSDWTPDASHVICGRSGPDPTKDGIYLIEVATGAATRLTTSEFHDTVGPAGECGGGENRAVFSPDGTRFAYEQQRCGTGDDPSSDESGSIVVADADGSHAKVIVPFGGVKTHPGGELSWSPVGDLIAYGTQDGVLMLIRPDGTDQHAVNLPSPGYVYGPAWSPDGKWLLITFVSKIDRTDLYVVAPDGSAMLRITDDRRVEAFTDWGVAP